MKKTLISLFAFAAASFVAAQTPVVVEPKSERAAKTTTTSSSTTPSSVYYGRTYDDYRERAGHWAVGFNFNAGTHNPVWAVGLGANLQYYATDDFRIEASYNGYIRRHYWATWDVNIDLHYLINVAEQLEIYPLLGVTFNHGRFLYEASYTEYTRNYGKIGLNLGGGIQYSINEHLFCKAEAYWKYCPERTLPEEMQNAADTETKLGQRCVLSAGVGYRF